MDKETVLNNLSSRENQYKARYTDKLNNDGMPDDYLSGLIDAYEASKDLVTSLDRVYIVTEEVSLDAYNHERLFLSREKAFTYVTKKVKELADKGLELNLKTVLPSQGLLGVWSSGNSHISLEEFIEGKEYTQFKH